MILITGGAGNLGTAVIENLLKRVSPQKIAGLYRDANKATAFANEGITVRIGDYSDKSSIEKAMVNVDKLLLITSNDENGLAGHKNVIDVAKEAGVKHIYYTGGALNKNVKQSKLGLLADAYITTENYIINSGLTYTIFKTVYMPKPSPFLLDTMQ